MNKTLRIITTILSLILVVSFCSCKTKENTPSKVSEVITMIDNLPSSTSITLDDSIYVENARTAYDELTIEEKNEITNINKLIELEETLINLKINNNIKKVNEIILILKDIDKVTLKYQNIIEEAYNIYIALENKHKEQINNVDILLNALSNLNTILKDIDKIKANASIVINAINSLPSLSSVQIKNKDDVNNVRNIYDKLDDNAKALVTNYDVLVNLEEKIINLELKEALETEAKPVIKAIKDLSNITNISLDNLREVENTRKLYDALSSKAKEIVTNYQILLDIEEKLEKEKLELTDEEYKVIFYSNGGIVENATYDETNNYYYITSSRITNLLDATKDSYKFLGWYKDELYEDGPYQVTSKSSIFFAKFVLSIDKVLDMVSDVASSNTTDNLILSTDDIIYTWSSSNPDVYYIDGDKGYVNMAYQLHQKQKVTITLNVNYGNGLTEELSKEITINPISYQALPSTPVATYFSTGAMYAYKEYNERYKENKTIFSESTKETLDIIYYSFITINANGTCQIDDPTYLHEVLKLKQHNVRIIGSVNGVSTTSCKYFMDLTADPVKRATFVKNLMDLVDENHLDGLDIDWETVSDSVKVVASSLNLLVQELREEMNSRQDENGTPYFLSCAVPASSWGTTPDRFDFVTLNKYLDYINLMSYDLNKSNQTTHLSALYSSEKDKGYGFGCVYGVNRLTSLGFSKNKIIIGCAGYGKAYSVSGVTSAGTYPALGVSGKLTIVSNTPGSFSSGTIFGNGISELINSNTYVEYTEYNSEGKLVGSYLYNKSKGIVITYDSTVAVKAKYEYASSIAGVGIMCWCYSEDTSDHVIDAISIAKRQLISNLYRLTF